MEGLTHSQILGVAPIMHKYECLMLHDDVRRMYTSESRSRQWCAHWTPEAADILVRAEIDKLPQRSQSRSFRTKHAGSSVIQGWFSEERQDVCSHIMHFLRMGSDEVRSIVLDAALDLLETAKRQEDSLVRLYYWDEYPIDTEVRFKAMLRVISETCQDLPQYWHVDAATPAFERGDRGSPESDSD